MAHRCSPLRIRPRRLAWRASFVGLLAALACPAVAVEVMRVEVQFIDAVRAEASQYATLTIAPKRLRIDQYTRLGQRRAVHSLIYHGGRDVIYSLDPRDQRYIAVDRALIASMGEELLAARRELESVLKRLPEDQRRSGEHLVGLHDLRDDGRIQAALWVKDEGSTIERLGRPCRKVSLWRAGAQVAGGCVVPWASMGIGPRDLDVFRQMANFQREVMGAEGLTPLEVVPDQPLDILVQLDGFPLELSRRQGGRLTSSIRVRRAARIDLPESVFEVPRGYALRSGFELFSIGLNAPASPSSGAPEQGAAPPPPGPARPAP